MQTKWLERYETLVDNEYLNTTQMAFILGRTPRRIREMRITLIAKLKLRDIHLPNIMLIPTELFLEEIGKDMKYFETKMIQEAKINKYRKDHYE